MLRLPVKINRNTIILLLLVLAGEVVAVIFIYVRMMMVVNGLNSELIDRQTKLGVARQLSALLPAEQKLLEQQQTKLGHLESALPTKEYIPTLLLQLDGLAHQTNNKIISLRPVQQLATQTKPGQPPAPAGGSSTPGPQGGSQTAAPPPPGPAGAPPPAATPGSDYDKYQVTMSLQGPYTNVMAFLMRLTSFPKIIAVDQFQVRTIANGPTGGVDLVSADVTFTSYVLKKTV